MGKGRQTGLQILERIEALGRFKFDCMGSERNTPYVGVKSIGEILQRQGDLTKAIANGTFTDETIKLLCSELERINKFLQEAFKSYGTTQPEFTTTTEPNDEKELLIELQSINKLFKSFDNNGNKRSIG
jgi:hypothetical protein